MSAATLNKQFKLASRPVGAATRSNFEYVEAAIPTPAEGEVLVKTQLKAKRNAQGAVKDEEGQVVMEPNIVEWLAL